MSGVFNKPNEERAIRAYYIRKHNEKGNKNYLYEDKKPYSNLNIVINEQTGELTATCDIRYIDGCERLVALRDMLIKTRNGRVSQLFNYMP